MPKKYEGVHKLVHEAQKSIEHLNALLATQPECSTKLPHPEKCDESIRKFDELEFTAQDLILEALQTRLNAYVPYSNFKVGAAFKSIDGKIFTGCNIENVAFSATCCAERTAMAKAISEGHTQFTEAAVVASDKKGFTTPCSVCRQMMCEFAPKDLRLYVAIARDNEKMMINGDDEVLVTSLYNILPHAFMEFK